MLEGTDAIQRHPNIRDKWASGNLMMCKAKCKVLHVGQSNPQYQYRLREEWIETALERRTWETQVDEKRDESAMSAGSPESQYRAT